MADLTFKGTIDKVLLEIAKGATSKIDADTKVTITDNAYTSADLLSVVTAFGGLNNKVTLEQTAASSPSHFIDTSANLITVLEGVKKYTGALTVYDSTSVGTEYQINAADLNKIASLTTGKVTATLDPATTIDNDTVNDLKDVKSTDNITFVPTDTDLVGIGDINALISLNKIISKANFAAINRIDGAANDVSAVKQALAILKDNAAIAVNILPASSPISAADANAIAKATKGVVTATIKDGGVAATLKALSDVSTADALTFKTTDTTVKAADLVALDSKLAGGTFDATRVSKITGEAKDVSSIISALALTIASSATLNVSGALTVAELNSIVTGNAANAVITATVQANAAEELAKLTTTAAAGDSIALTVNGSTALATDLASIIAATTGRIKLEATEVRGDVAELNVVYTTNKAQFTALGNENIIILTDTPTAAVLNGFAAATTGKVTATLNSSTAIDQTTVKALKDVKTSDNITLVSSITTLVGTKDNLNALLAIKKLIPNANFDTVAALTAVDAKDVAIVKNVLKLIDPTSPVTFSAGELSAKDANDIAKATAGAVTATIKAGSIAATLKALSDVNATDDIAFTTTDKSAKASDLVALHALFKTAAKFNVATVKTLTGDAKDAADIASALAIIDATPATNLTEVKISGNVDAADIGAIIGATAGKVTATLKADTATALVAALADANLPTGGNAINVTVDDTIITNAANLSKAAGISGLTSGKIKVDALEVTGTFAQLNELYVTNKAQFTNLGNENVVISAATTALNVDSIAKATSGILTATVSGANANVLVSQLKNANAKDALNITVLDNPTGTSAKDLLTLDGKTSVALAATAVTAISGSAAEIGKLAGAGITLSGTQTYTISGTIKATDLNIIAADTTGDITATVAADTAEKLNYALSHANISATDKLTLKVTGSTAAAADLIALNAKTDVNIQVDAKEVTGTAAQLAGAGAGIYVIAGFAGLANKNVKVTDTAGSLAEINAILGGTTGVVTASVTGIAAALNAGLANATSGKDALALTVTGTTATAAQLLALDAKTAAKVDATGLSTNVTGSATDLKKLVAAKGVELAKNVAIEATGITAAADLGAVLKATTGVVTANVTADTAARLNAALKDASSADALTLSVNGATAAAKDLLTLADKTSVAIKLNVGAITGNITEITKVFTSTGEFVAPDLGAAAATISGTVKATDADVVAAKTTGVVTATIQADTAAQLVADFSTSVGTSTGIDRLKFTVTGDNAAAANLNTIDGLTAETVNAAAIKNINGTTTTGAVDVNAVYLAAQKGDISGLGNETVTFSTTTVDADINLVKAINDFTTGLITLPTLTFDKGVDKQVEALDLATGLGDLGGITGLAKIDAANAEVDSITMTLANLLAANDGSTSGSGLAFTIVGDNASTDSLAITDITGWTLSASSTYDLSNTVVAAQSGTLIYTKTGSTDTITITLTDMVFNA